MHGRAHDLRGPGVQAQLQDVWLALVGEQNRPHGLGMLH